MGIAHTPPVWSTTANIGNGPLIAVLEVRSALNRWGKGDAYHSEVMAQNRFSWAATDSPLKDHPLYPSMCLLAMREVINSRLYSTVRDSLGLSYDCSFELSMLDRLKAGWFICTVSAHPSRIMDGSFANQVLAQMLMFEKKFADLPAADKQSNLYVEVLPKHLDEEVAAMMVGGFGGVLTYSTHPRVLAFHEGVLLAALMRLLLELSASAPNAAALVREGGMTVVINVIKLLLGEPSHGVVAISVEVLWNALEHSATALDSGPSAPSRGVRITRIAAMSCRRRAFAADGVQFLRFIFSMSEEIGRASCRERV